MAEIEWNIKWTKRAYDSLEKILILISQIASEKTAQNIVEEILNSIDTKIKNFPYMYEKVPEIKDETIRQALVKKYRIVYEIYEKERQIRIISIFHSSRKFKF